MKSTVIYNAPQHSYFLSNFSIPAALASCAALGTRLSLSLKGSSFFVSGLYVSGTSARPEPDFSVVLGFELDSPDSLPFSARLDSRSWVGRCVVNVFDDDEAWDCVDGAKGVESVAAADEAGDDDESEEGAGKSPAS